MSANHFLNKLIVWSVVASSVGLVFYAGISVVADEPTGSVASAERTPSEPFAPEIAATGTAVIEVIPVNPPAGEPPYPPGTTISGQELRLPAGAEVGWFDVFIRDWDPPQPATQFTDDSVAQEDMLEIRDSFDELNNDVTAATAVLCTEASFGGTDDMCLFLNTGSGRCCTPQGCCEAACANQCDLITPPGDHFTKGSSCTKEDSCGGCTEPTGKCCIGGNCGPVACSAECFGGGFTAGVFCTNDNCVDCQACDEFLGITSARYTLRTLPGDPCLVAHFAAFGGIFSPSEACDLAMTYISPTLVPPLRDLGVRVRFATLAVRPEGFRDVEIAISEVEIQGEFTLETIAQAAPTEQIKFSTVSAFMIVEEDQTIPAVSTWGIVAMALLVAVGARVYFRKRKAESV